MFLKNNFLCPFGVSNGIIFCNKKEFFKSGGFNGSLKKGEDGDFVRRIKKECSFAMLDDYVISSTRRFDKIGYIRTGIYWIKEFLMPGDENYEIIR